MDKPSIYQDLVAILKSKFLRDRMLVFRGQAELQELSSWVLRDEDIGRELVDISDLNRMIEKCNRCVDKAARYDGQIPNHPGKVRGWRGHHLDYPGHSHPVARR